MSSADIVSCGRVTSKDVLLLWWYNVFLVWIDRCSVNLYLSFDSSENTSDYVRNILQHIKLELDTMTYRIMVSEVGYWHSRHRIMVLWCQKVVNEFTDDNLDLYFIRSWYPHLQQGFHCVILDLEDGQFLICSRNSDFQWLHELLFGFFMNPDISHLLAQFSSLSSSRGENTWKHKAIHEIVVNLDNLSSFFMSNTCFERGTQATQAKDTQATLTHHTKRQRKFELFNPSQASLRSSPG